MLNLARLIFGGGTSKTSERDVLVDQAMEKALDVSDARLRAVSGYQRRLREPVECAVEHVLAVVDTFPTCLEISPQRFTSDPKVRAFFGSADQVREVFSDSRLAREFLARPENASLTYLYGGIRMRLGEKRTLSTELRGDVVQREVLRTAMNFGDHYFALPNVDEQRVREDVQERAFVRLVECALERMTAEKENKSELEKQRSLLKTKLQFVRARGLGMQPLAEPGEGSSKSLAEIEGALEDVETKLSQSVPRTATLEHELELLKDVLSHPRDYLSIEKKSDRITRMGIKAEPTDSDSGDEIGYTEVTLGTTKMVCELVRYPVAELLPPRKLGDLPRF